MTFRPTEKHAGPSGFPLRIMVPRWRKHPAVRSPDQLTVGERAADRMRNGMGSWTFVIVALVFLSTWMAFNRDGGFDPYPFILLNLVLSCVAALQGAILLIAARRSDQIASELASHDYQVNRRAAEVLDRVSQDIAEVRAQQAQLMSVVNEIRASYPD